MFGNYGSLLIVSAVAFLATWYFIPKIMKFLLDIKVVGTDVHKPNRPLLPTSGGIAILVGLLAGTLTYIALATFITGVDLNFKVFFATIITITIAAIVGFFDDLYLSKKHRRGLSQFKKALLTVPIVVPLIAVKSGVTSMAFPFIGRIELGLLYPVIFVPLAIICCTNAYNMLAGYNGIESGLGIVAFFSLGLFALIKGQYEAMILAFVIFSSLIVFFKYNKFPAKFLPGDSLTYLLGASFAVVAIIGNMEKFAIIVFIPFIIEAFLKLRSRFRAHSVGILRPDGTIEPHHEKIYSLTHLMMRLGYNTEKKITNILITIEVLICIFAFIFCLWDVFIFF